MGKKGISSEGTIIFLMIITILIMIILNMKSPPDIKPTGYLWQSETLTKYSPELGYQFKNDGDKDGMITVKISTDNKNITFIKNEITRTVQITKDSNMLTNILFEVNKSSFNNLKGNFTIFFDVFDSEDRRLFNWNLSYEEKCPTYYNGLDCTFELKK